MKKKGFTLVELLAVLVILAVIALITTPIIYGIIKNARIKAFKNKVYAVEDAANTYYEELMLEGDEEEFEEGLDGIYSLTLNLSNPEDRSKINTNTLKKGIVTITDEGKVSVIAIEDRLCGQKLSSSDLVDMLDIRNDFTCYLLDSSSDNLGTQDILTAINNLKTSNEELKTSNEQLVNEVGSLKESIRNIQANGVGTTSALNKIYPVGSIYISTTLKTTTEVADTLGGKWEVYGDGRVLRSSTGNPEQTNNTNGNITLTTANLPEHTHSIPSLSGTAQSAGTHSHTVNTTKTTTSTMSLTAQSAGNHSHSHPSGQLGFAAFCNGSDCQSTGVGFTTQNRYYYAGWSRSTAEAGAHTHSVTGSVTIPALSGTAQNAGAHTHTVTTTESTTGSTGSGTAFSVLDPYITVYMYKRVG